MVSHPQNLPNIFKKTAAKAPTPLLTNIHPQRKIQQAIKYAKEEGWLATSW